MAASRKIRVMISSRCNDRFPSDVKGSATLSEIRRELKQDIEAQGIFGELPFEVWINEDTPPQPGSADSWEVCLAAVRDCDILLALSNGNAGWAKAAGDIGICHAELATGLDLSPSKVRLMSLGNIPCDNSEQGQRNRRFQDYVAEQSLFRGREAETVDDLRELTHACLANAVVTLVQQGVRESKRGGFYSGQALDWSRMDFAQRQAEIVRVLAAAVEQRPGGRQERGQLFVRVGATRVLFAVHAVPASMTVAAAREMVGQPFLKDHEHAPDLAGGVGGPVHVIGCHRGITEPQALKLLGFPDATVVTAPFGVYVADNVQKIQLVLIAQCRDDAYTRHGVQRFFDWLEQTGEGTRLADRAAARARIVRAIAKESPPEP